MPQLDNCQSSVDSLATSSSCSSLNQAITYNPETFEHMLSLQATYTESLRRATLEQQWNKDYQGYANTAFGGIAGLAFRKLPYGQAITGIVTSTYKFTNKMVGTLVFDTQVSRYKDLLQNTNQQLTNMVRAFGDEYAPHMRETIARYPYAIDYIPELDHKIDLLGKAQQSVDRSSAEDTLKQYCADEFNKFTDILLTNCADDISELKDFMASTAEANTQGISDKLDSLSSAVESLISSQDDVLSKLSSLQSILQSQSLTIADAQSIIDSAFIKTKNSFDGYLIKDSEMSQLVNDYQTAADQYNALLQNPSSTPEQIQAALAELNDKKTQIIHKGQEINAILEEVGAIANSIDQIGKIASNLSTIAYALGCEDCAKFLAEAGSKLQAVASIAMGVAMIYSGGVLSGLVTLTSGLASLFSSGDDGIGEALQQISAQINQGFISMHLRFDRIEGILSQMSDQLYAIHSDVRTIALNVDRAISLLGDFYQTTLANFRQLYTDIRLLDILVQQANQRLISLDIKLDTGHRELYSQQYTLTRDIVLNLKRVQPYPEYKMDITDAIGYYFIFRKRILQDAMGAILSDDTSYPPTLENVYRFVSEDDIYYKINFLRRVAEQVYSLPPSPQIVNPVVWSEAVNVLVAYLAQTPEYPLTSGHRQDFQQMMQKGQAFIDFIIKLKSNSAFWQRVVGDYRSAVDNVLDVVYDNAVSDATPEVMNQYLQNVEIKTNALVTLNATSQYNVPTIEQLTQARDTFLYVATNICKKFSSCDDTWNACRPDLFLTDIISDLPMANNYLLQVLSPKLDMWRNIQTNSNGTITFNGSILPGVQASQNLASFFANYHLLGFTNSQNLMNENVLNATMKPTNTTANSYLLSAPCFFPASAFLIDLDTSVFNPIMFGSFACPNGRPDTIYELHHLSDYCYVPSSALKQNLTTAIQVVKDAANYFTFANALNNTWNEAFRVLNSGYGGLYNHLGWGKFQIFGENNKTTALEKWYNTVSPFECNIGNNTENTTDYLYREFDGTVNTVAYRTAITLLDQSYHVLKIFMQLAFGLEFIWDEVSNNVLNFLFPNQAVMTSRELNYQPGNYNQSSVFLTTSFAEVQSDINDFANYLLNQTRKGEVLARNGSLFSGYPEVDQTIDLLTATTELFVPGRINFAQITPQIIYQAYNSSDTANIGLYSSAGILNRLDSSQNTALILSAQACDDGTTAELLSDNANANSINTQGLTALDYAIACSAMIARIQLVEMLVAHGAIDTQNALEVCQALLANVDESYIAQYADSFRQFKLAHPDECSGLHVPSSSPSSSTPPSSATTTHGQTLTSTGSRLETELWPYVVLFTIMRKFELLARNVLSSGVNYFAKSTRQSDIVDDTLLSQAARYEIVVHSLSQESTQFDDTENNTPDCVPSYIYSEVEGVKTPALFCKGDDYVTYVFPKVSEYSVIDTSASQIISGDTFDTSTCRPVEFYGKPSVYCEGKHTSIVYTPELASRPFENASAQIQFAAVGVHLISKAVSWATNQLVDKEETVSDRIIDAAEAKTQLEQLTRHLTALLKNLSRIPKEVRIQKKICWVEDGIEDYLEEIATLSGKKEIKETELLDIVADVEYFKTESTSALREIRQALNNDMPQVSVSQSARLTLFASSTPTQKVDFAALAGALNNTQTQNAGLPMQVPHRQLGR